MAEEDGQEKEFDPSAAKLQKFRDEGKIAQSKDIGSAAQLLMALLAFSFLGSELMGSVERSVTWTIYETLTGGSSPPSVRRISERLVLEVGPQVLTLCLLLGFAAVSSGLAQTEFNFTFKPLTPNLAKLNPLSKIPQIFGPKKLGMNLLLSTLKIMLGATVIGVIFVAQLPAITALCLAPLEAAEQHIYATLFIMAAATTVVITMMAIPDYIWQRKQMDEQLKMTRQEYKRDQEEQEGKPLIKQRRRQMHRDLSLNKIIENVPQADVIVTNPTHFAVAIKYDPEAGRAPIVTAKGTDALAMQIRGIARRHGVPIVENRPLARTLWRKVKVGKQIPSQLFQAVAEVLAKVYRRKRASGG